FSVESTKASEISPSFFPFLLEVRKLLSKISSAISPDSAALLYRLINQKIAECFLEIISSTSFNCNGASQMLFDISSSLIPLLNSFYNDGLHNLKALDEPKFNGVITSLRLLSLPKAISLLLFDELKRIPNEMAPSVLAPHNICAMSRDNALNLLKQRCDLNLETDLKITW
ncbi:unnamed protein product, partial [Dracunculus medinensis]|uniref:Conserved oligomeric Golgi complex subunit 1 n=1 Tax=Dracunculus medinensis TaxID=318479 RepID=A0A0N4UIK1_DRAME